MKFSEALLMGGQAVQPAVNLGRSGASLHFHRRMVDLRLHDAGDLAIQLVDGR
jgi:hypothetical protein